METGIKYKPKRLLVDSRLFAFLISPETQAWGSAYHEKLNLFKMAFVVSEDIFAQVSIEMAVEK